MQLFHPGLRQQKNYANPATANLIGLIVRGTTKVEGEMSGRTKIEAAAKRTAEAIG
ncbi:hypothetical protein [Candidatus Nitrospira neomarina]|uniref:Uncharacterized protein n=1 Tax=Candidatus Nitrospira neomarina TaxID=3020899 RepID=A0AA96K1Z7_9BACT|nr:hypothetical protein [Candidatus Nitrospira neomarina]WNM63586.1 hypothetical protein PQG83_07480 [Candidatus Nitrospira neomarina]